MNDPDRDVKRLFPESTGSKTLYVSIAEKGGGALLREVEKRLRGTFKGLYETLDVPSAMYLVFRGRDPIGYIHGFNQKGQFAGIRVFLAMDLEGNIRAFYFQKLTRHAARLRDAKFGEQFIGLNLQDFYGYILVTGEAPSQSRVASIKNPSPEAEPDFRATLRATKKTSFLLTNFCSAENTSNIFE